MLTQTVEYALRAVTYLASEEGTSKTTEDVAEKTKVPVAYLAKILQGLARQGIIRTQRGVGGGVTIARPPAELTILEVVNAVEPIKRIKTCPLGIQSHGSRLCPLHTKLDAALASLEEAFGNSTLADILSDPSASKPLCEVNSQPGTITGIPLTIRGKK
jgi:Rrf2 family protein